MGDEDHRTDRTGEERWRAGEELQGEEFPPMFNVPTVILVLIGLLALVHFGRSLLSPEADLRFLIEMAFIPARYVEGLMGSGVAGFTSFVTYNFLHGDLTHLGVNSIWLLAMGSAVAKRIGAARFLAFSFFCGLFAALAHLLTHFGEIVPMIGASGAISGHMAAAIRFIFSAPGGASGAGMLQGNLRGIPLQPLSSALRDGRVLAVLVIWLLTNVLFGTGIIATGEDQNPVAWQAHIGGFVAGLLLFSLFDPPGNGRSGAGEPDGDASGEDDGGGGPDIPSQNDPDQNRGSS